VFDPDIDLQPQYVSINGVVCDEGTMGSLSQNTWDYGDNDGLGFNTLYVRLTGRADPDDYMTTPCYIQLRTTTGDMRSDPSAFRFFDELYVDTTWSRVMLGNSKTLASCSILEPQIPSAWSTSEITVTINLGGLSGSKAYLYVFDSNNAPSNANAFGSSKGYPVKIR